MRQEFGINSFKLEDFLIQNQDLCVFSSSKAHYLPETGAVIVTRLRKQHRKWPTASETFSLNVCCNHKSLHRPSNDVFTCMHIFSPTSDLFHPRDSRKQERV